MAITIAQAVTHLMRIEPFYGLFLLGINRYFDDSIPTACVRRNGINIEIAINKEYWDGLDDSLCPMILAHEVGHILYRHLWMQKEFKDSYRFNVSADLQINGFLPKVSDEWFHPKQFNFEIGQGTKWYYENLPEDINEENCPFEFGHSWEGFDDLSDAEKELISNQIDYQAKRATEEAMKSCGSLPANFKEYLDGLFKKRPAIFNWKSYFRRMIGTVQSIELKKTRKKDSTRFPEAAGLKHRKKSNICVVIDTSGSVSTNELSEFISEIYHVWKAGANITVIENDATIQKISIYNGKWNGEINGRGGTDFRDVTNWFNERRKEFNTIIFFTDGYVNVDLKIMCPSIWVISSNGYHQTYPGQTIYIPKEN